MANERWRRSSRGLFPTQHTALDRFSARGPTDGWSRLRFDALERRDLLAFAPAVSYPTGSAPHYLAAADLNFDGNIDLVGAATGSDQIMILMGTANGTFQPGTTVPVADEPFHVEIADFNADGKLDLAVPNYGSNLLSVALGNGNGTFQSRVDYAADSFPTAVDSGDLNGDGKLDLVVVSNLGQSARVMIGVGDGTFVAGTSYSIPQSFGVAVADFDGDGKLDVAASGYVTGTMSVLKGNGNGTLQPRVDYVVGPNPYSVVVADFNRDGKLDIATPAYGANYVSILIGDGSGGFPQRLDSATGARPLGLTSADYNMDGKLDLAMALAQQNPDTTYSVGVIHGNGNGTFQSQTAYTVGTNPFGITSGDFNRDGAPDLASTNEHSHDVSVLMNSDSFVGSMIAALAWNDLDRDGVQDAGEPPLAGVAAELFFSADPTPANGNDVRIGTMTTPANGVATFSGLAAGYYYLAFRPAIGHAFTSQDAGSDDTLDSDANRLGLTSIFELSAGQTDTSRDVGLASATYQLVVTDASQNPDIGRLIAVSAATGGQAVLSAGDILRQPFGVAIEASGNFVTGDSAALGGPGAVVRVDSLTGMQTVLATGGNLIEPSGIAVEASGKLLVTDPVRHAVYRIDPATGAQTTVSSDGNLNQPLGIVVDAAGFIFVISHSPSGGGALVKIHPGTGVQTVISSGGNFVAPTGLAIESDGQFLVADFVNHNGTGLVIRVNPTTGAQTVVATGNLLVDPFGLTVAQDGSIYVADANSPAGTGKIVSVHPSTGAQTLVSSAGNLIDPRSVILAPIANGSIGSFVWHDLDSDGVQDVGETGIAGAVVKLFNPVDGVIGNGNDVSLGTRITDADGNYTFENVPSDSYYFEFRTPVGFTFTTQDAGGNDTLDSDANPSTGRTAIFALRGGATESSRAAGLVGAAPSFGFALKAGSSNSDSGRSVITDSNGNIYVVGNFTGTADFDSGPGTFAISSFAGSSDAFVAKYTATGALVWVRQFGGNSADSGYGVVTDNTGAVYLVGQFSGAVNFGSSPGATVFTSVGNSLDVFVAKLNSTGDLLWARQFGGAAAEIAYQIALDGVGNVYTVGALAGTVDFDPGPAVFNLDSAGGDDAFVAKLAGNGDLIWARSFGGNANDIGYGLAVDNPMSVYVSGYFATTADFDPGVGTSNLTSAGGNDAYVAKLDSAGNLVWARQFGGSAPDEARGLALDVSGNVYTTGFYDGPADFDPGIGVFQLPHSGGGDAYVSKLDNAGNHIWARQLAGNLDDIGRDLWIDGNGHVFTVGSFVGTADFDPGSAVSNLVSGGSFDVFLSRLDSAGNFVAALQIGGSASDQAHGVYADPNGNIYTTGGFSTSADFDPRSSTFSLTSAGDFDFYLAKFNQFGAVGGFVWNDLDSDGIQDAGEPGIGGAVAELFDPVDGVIGNGNDVSLGTQVTDASGNYWYDSFLPGSYYLEFRAPVGFTFTTQDAGGNDTLDSDANSSTGRTAIFVVAAGQNDSSRAAGLVGAFPGFGWARREGSSAIDSGYDITTDADGFVYTTGFAALAGGYGADDIFISKFTSVGALVWQRVIGGTTNDQGQSIAVDATGNVYVSGIFRATVDFDPGSGVANLSSTGEYDAFVMKLDPNGNLIWAKSAGGAGVDQAIGVALDALGGVIITGMYQLTVDFDPGPGTANISNASAGVDMFVWKLAASDGSFQWVRGFGGSGSGEDVGYDITTDAAGNIFVAGAYAESVDFDPGAGTTTLTAAGSSEAFVLKLTSAGSFVWAQSIGGTQYDRAYGIAVDAAGSVFATGILQGTADLNPGAGTFNVTSGGQEDVFVVKLDSSGGFLWGKLLGGVGRDISNALSVDSANNVFVAGYFESAVDFDPGAGTFLHVAQGQYDAYLWKLTSDGQLSAAMQWGLSAGDTAVGIGLDSAGTIYLTGNTNGTVDFDPGPGQFNLTTVADRDAYFWKVFAAALPTPASVSGFVWCDLDSDGVQDAGEAGIGGAVAELFNPVDGVIGNGDDVSLGTRVTDASGNYTFDNVPSGSYYLEFRTPVGFTFTTHDAGGNDALDSDANSSTGRTAIFAVAAGQNDSSRDAGLIGAFPGFGWATTQGSTLQDFGFDVVVDSGGFVYSTGATTTPPGTNSEDIVISKHTNVGALVWRKVLNGASIDQGQSIALDAAGNVFVSGIFRSTVDFDPGPGVVSLAADGSLYDAFVMKLDTEGNLLWVKSAGSTGADQSLGLAVDPSGNVIVTGMYQFTVDFDPGPGIANLTFTGPGNVDIFYWKLSGADGSLQWVKGIGGSGEDVGYDVTTDASGNVYATGSFEGSVDFDPNAGVTPLASSGSSDIFALKLTSAGSLAWAKKIGGTQFERAYGIKVDSSGNVVVSGYTDGTADLDPGAGTDNVTAAGLEDSLVVKLDSSGNYVWGRILGGTGRDMVNALALDATGNVYATGYFQSVIDFDPGAGLFPLVANGTYDAFLWKLTSTGSLANAAQWGGAGTGSGIGLAVDATHVYVTGYLDDTVDFDPGVGTFNQTTVGGWDSFVWKVNPALLTSSSVGSFVWSDLDSDGVQDAGETGTSGVVVELFHSADGIIGNGNDVSLGTQTTDVNGAYSFATVPAGSYYLRFRKPNGFIFSPLNAGGDDALDSDANYYGFTEVFTLAAGQIDTSRDAGLRAAAERIVFASDRDGDFDIYEMDTSGANVVQLINVAGADNNGSWSPDGDKLLFSSDRDGDPEVYVMNADGSGVTKLTNNMSLDSGPIWSPDGSKIAFVSQRDGNYEIYVMNADGSNQTRLTNNVAQDLAPDWSPDGSRIVFYSNRTGGGDIYVVDAVGGTPIRLTTHAAVDTTPHFSPDGAKIAFDSARDGDHEIWVMNADGSNPVQLTSNTQFDQGPRWSPDGTKLVFYRDFGVNREVFTMNADGSNQTNISNHTAADDNPAWSQKAVGTLGNFVWNDLDGDGIQDAGEPGLSGVTVSVYTQAVGGVAVATTTTNGSGQYTFSALAAQTYYVEVTLPSGYVLSPQGQGSDDALDSDFDRTSRRTGPVVLSAGQNLTSVDAGMFQPVTISGRKYHDLNGDGSDLTPSVVVLQPSAATGKDTYNIRDLGSTALHRANTNYGGSDGLAIGQGGSTGTLFRTLIEFVGLSSIPAGTEIVSARLGFTGIGGAGLAPAVVYPMQQTWTEGTQSSDEPATPDGATWQTFDGTGAWPGISGFNAENGSGFTSQSANLASPLGNGDIAGTAGVQSWINLNAQTVEDWIDGAAVNRGMLIVATNESSANSGVLMASSDHSTAAWRPALELTLETRDPGLAGWTIYLDLDNDNQLDANEPFDITDANGEYSFTDLPAGNYTIREVQQPGWVQTAPASGFHSLTLTAGAAVIGRDFGNQVGALQVTSLTPTATGFIADFNRDLNPAALNLFDEGGVLGPSDITVTGASTGAVRGSVVVDSALRRITFIATSGVLAPDTYSVAFKSGVNAFKDSQGGLLDGNRDGTTGDDYSGNFTVANPAAGAITITMPNFARGYGQSVNLPASGSTGLPVAISNAQGVKSASFTLHYNPALLTITGATAGAGISGSVSLDTSMPGMAVVSVTNSTQLSAASGAQTLVHLTASVPSGAPYGSKQILDLANLHVLDTSPVPAELPAIDDDGIHVAAYFGDANGSQSYNAPDATAAQRIIVGLDTGLASYQLADPYLIVDINGNNQVQSDDVTQIQRAIVGLSTNDIPSLPGLSPPASGGPDPIVSLPQNLAASVGETVVVPIELFVTEPTGITLAGADLAIAYDAALLELTAADVGQLLVGFGLSVNASTPGVIRLTLTGSPLDLAHAASGILASLQFTVLAGAGSSTPLNLLASSDSLRTALYDSLGRPLTLAPSPTNADDDLVDGCLQIGPAPPESLAAMVDRALAEEDDWQLAGAI